MDGEEHDQKDDEIDPKQMTKRLKEVRIEAEEGLQKNEQTFEKTEILSQTITGAKPKERSDKPHSQLEILRERSTSQAAAASPKQLDRDAERSLLIMKLGLGGPQGFKYEIDPAEYVQHNESKSSDLESSSEEERLESQRRMTSVHRAGSGFVGLNFPAWGVDAGGGGATADNSWSRSDNQRKTNVAIITS